MKDGRKEGRVGLVYFFLVFAGGRVCFWRDRELFFIGFFRGLVVGVGLFV